MMKIYVQAWKDLLESDHYQVSVAADGKKGLSLALSNVADLIILDIMLPHMDGYEILKEVRTANLGNSCDFFKRQNTGAGQGIGFSFRG